MTDTTFVKVSLDGLKGERCPEAPDFNFTESFMRTVAQFENLSSAAKADYYRARDKARNGTGTAPGEGGET